MNARTLLLQIRRELAGAADPLRAQKMQTYMKSAMPYHGVPLPQVRALCRALFAECAWQSADAWSNDVRQLFHGARFREEWYAALALAGHRGARTFQGLEAMPLYEELIVTGAWWDVVDDLADHRVGPILKSNPKEMKKLMRIWSRCDNLWKRRTSIICQLGFKSEIDLALLYDCMEPSLDSREFFLRKAIGWALRQHARVDPAEVSRYVRAHEDRLSGLSKREALKHVGEA